VLGLNIQESRVRPVWDVALRVGLLEPAGKDPLTASPMDALSTAASAPSAN
jgi:hypothetical protein